MATPNTTYLRSASFCERKRKHRFPLCGFYSLSIDYFQSLHPFINDNPLPPAKMGRKNKHKNKPKNKGRKEVPRDIQVSFS